MQFSLTREKNKKKQKEKKDALEQRDLLEFKKTQKKLIQKIKTKEEVDKLKDLINAWVLTRQSVEKVLSWEILNSWELKEILEKIDELSKIDSNRRILPRDFNITEDEYLGAITNFDKKVVLLWKIDEALDYIYKNMWGWWLTFSLFSFLWYNLILSEDTQKVQWSLIDIKNNIINTKTL